MDGYEAAVMAMIGTCAACFAWADMQMAQLRYVQAMRRSLVWLRNTSCHERADPIEHLMHINLFDSRQARRLTRVLHATAQRIGVSPTQQPMHAFSRECARQIGRRAISGEDALAYEEALHALFRYRGRERLRALDAVDQRLCERERCLAGEVFCKAQLIRALGAAGGAAAFLFLV